MEATIEKSDRLALSLPEISERTGLSVGFLRGEVRRGKLSLRPFGRRRLVLHKDLMALLEDDGRDEHANDAKAS